MTIERALFQSPPLLKSLPEHLDASQALKEGHFVPFFQPLVTLRTGQLAGFEVLARWKHPLEGLIPPDKFIPVAEQDGWIGELTQQILQKAFAAAAALPAPLTLAVNISPLQLRDASLPEQIRSLASEAEFPLSRLVIEITESALIDTPRSASSIGAELKKLGCGLALDDFGTGYSSLTHLQALPFDKLKVDRSFVGSMAEKRESRKIVAAVIGLGQSLGLSTVAEGIETQEQAEIVLWLGCEFGQGYFYGRPMPAEELPACISAPRSKLLVKSGTAWKKVSAANLELSSTQRLAQLQSIYDGAPVGLAFLDQKLRYASLNQRLADMNGASVEDHLGNPVAEMIPELFPYVEPYIRRALSGEALSDVETQVPKTDKALLLSYQPARDEAGEVIGVSVAIMDITERKRAERALMQSEAHYRSMVDLNPQVLWIMDPQGRNLDVSPRWDKTTGLMKSQSTDHEWLRAVHPDDIQPTVRSIAESRRDGSGIDVQYRVADGIGHWVWKRSRGAPRFDAAGNIVCWYGSVDDIDGPTRAPKMLSRVETFEDVNTRDFVASLSLVFGNQRKREEVLEALEILDTPPEAEFDDLVSLASEICSTPISVVSLIDSDRQWFKAAVGLAASETPITVSFCAHAIEHVGLFVVGDATKDERFNQNPLVTGAPHIRFYAGMPLYAGEGVPIGTLCVIDTVPRTLTPSQTKALAILSHQVQARLDLRSERKKQASETKARLELTARLEVNNQVLRDANDQLETFFVEREQNRLQHISDQNELRRRAELDDSKNEYVAMVSHELRAPLTSVRGAIGLLSAGLVNSDEDKRTKLFSIALANLDRMMRLVNDVLDLERIASGVASPQLDECSLGELANEAIESMMAVAQQLNVQVNMKTSTILPCFQGNADKILQVIVNLLSNAIKFSPPGATVALEVEALGETVTLRVTDEGRGIPDDQLEKVFGRFRQVEDDDARRLGGTGLGLAICRAIIEQHQGKIWAERNAGRGTSFILALPCSRESLSDADTWDVNGPSSTAGLLTGPQDTPTPASEVDSMKVFKLSDLGLWLGESSDKGIIGRIFEGISNGVTISDATLPGAPLIYVNPAFERMTGYSAEDVVGLNCNFLQGTDKDQPGVHRIRSAIREAGEERVLLRNYRKDGTLFWNELYLSPIFDASGVLSHFVGVQNDVTAEIEAKLQLSEERNRLHAASECSMDCLYICEAIRDEGGELVDFIFNFVNSNGAEAVSLSTSELIGARMCEVLPANKELGLFDLYKNVVLTGKPLVHELAKVDQDGCSSWMRVQAVKLRDGIVITASDITLRKREEERTLFRAEHDPLTALPNRSVLRDRVESGLLWAKRHEGMLAVFLIDLDGFKAINDSLGHAAGDEALLIVASRLTKCIRAVDSVIRVGGDEFVIVLPELRRQSDAEVLAARMLDVLRLPMHIEDQDVCVTSSIGVALYPQSARTTEELLARSDAAMYVAKRGGKNKYEMYSVEKVEATLYSSLVIA